MFNLQRDDDRVNCKEFLEFRAEFFPISFALAWPRLATASVTSWMTEPAVHNISSWITYTCSESACCVEKKSPYLPVAKNQDNSGPKGMIKWPKHM